MEELQTKDLDGSAFVDPPMSSEAEIDSFDFQASSVNLTEKPSKVNEALDYMERAYGAVKWKIRQDFCSKAHIREVIEYIRDKLPEKSPGAIYLRQGLCTNGDVINILGVEGVLAAVEARIEELLTGDARYAADPIRIFIKREPHKASKAMEKRWRLIWGISLIDQIIDRLLYQPVLDAEIENCASIPAKPGYSFKYGGTDRMVRQYDDGEDDWISFDAKSFDITAPSWALQAARDLNERLCLTTDQDLLAQWRALSLARELATQYGTFVFSNGVVCRKVKPCIQPSGRLTTISTNCKIVILLRFLYDLEKGREPRGGSIIAMGDDTVQKLKDFEDFVVWLKGKGINFTVESEPGKFASQNFCSTRFEKNHDGVYVPIPLNWKKNSYELCHPEAKIAKDAERLRENRSSCLQSLCCEYSYSEHFQELHSMLASYAPPEKFRSKAFFRNIVTGHETAAPAEKSVAVFDNVEAMEAFLLPEEGLTPRL